MEKMILKRALISEKSFAQATKGKFSFAVDQSATKEIVAKSVEELFGVNVLSVNILNTIGKIKRSKKGFGKRSDCKKAIVTLKKGQKIDLFEIEKPEEKGKAKKQDEKIEKTESDTKVTVREKKK
jgi:large subunit ribosomal protein L23